MQTSTPCFLSMNADVRSGGTTVRGATNCIAAWYFDAAIRIKDNCYKIMRGNCRVSEVPVRAYVCIRSDIALKNY
jgi:hypothetical protein